ncbi:hypothetical protein [Pectobacterium polaris]|uniref:hypothetical protein n=1 Tax=Pectobacterium polaris TaxID=2042057 RepID=UPI001F224EC0|nr:hypothetical protein [Pectobacterium polaris]
MISFPIDTEENWLSVLKPYQRGPISKFIEENGEDKAIELWLSSSGISNTSPFGGIVTGRDTNNFSTRFKEEFKKFICGDEKYDQDRKGFAVAGGEAKAYIVGAISSALAAPLGVTASFLVPAIVLMIIVVMKIGVNAYCQI